MSVPIIDLCNGLLMGRITRSDENINQALERAHNRIIWLESQRRAVVTLCLDESEPEDGVGQQVVAASDVLKAMVEA